MGGFIPQSNGSKGGGRDGSRGPCQASAPRVGPRGECRPAAAPRQVPVKLARRSSATASARSSRAGRLWHR